MRLWRELMAYVDIWRQISRPYVIMVPRITDDDDCNIRYETIKRFSSEQDALDAALHLNVTTRLNAAVYYQWGTNKYTLVHD